MYKAKFGNANFICAEQATAKNRRYFFIFRCLIVK